MKILGRVCAAALLACATTSFAADVESGFAVGDKVTTYSSTKCSGPNDGIFAGDSLCYT